MHGELWLTDTALVRRRLSLRASTGHTLRSSVPAPVVVDVVLPAPSHPTDRDLPLAGLVSARLHRGRLSDRLLLTAEDGASSRLLWLSSEPASDVLAVELAQRLGARFALD